VNTSRVRIVAILGLALAGWLGAGVASGQSLGDVARREAERRKAAKGPVSVYTNDNVRPATPPEPRPAPESPVPGAGAPAEAAAPPAGTPAAAGESAAQAPKQDEAYWRKRITDLEGLRDRNAFMMEAVQSRINGLWTDFTARDDPAQRAVIESDRQRALAELDRMKKDQQALDRKIADVHDEARRANVPPGWLR